MVLIRELPLFTVEQSANNDTIGHGSRAPFPATGLAVVAVSAIGRAQWWNQFKELSCPQVVSGAFQRPLSMSSVTSIKKPKFSREEPEARRQLMIEATIRCLAKQGSAGVTVENICKEAGVSRGLLSHYFNGKDDIIVQTYMQISEKFSQKVKNIFECDKTKPYDKLKDMIAVSFKAPIFSKEEVAVWLSLCNLVRIDERLSEIDRRLYNRYRLNIAKAFDDLAEEKGITINATRAGLGLSALIDGLWLQWSLDQDAFVPQEAEVVCLDYVNRLIGQK